MLRRIMRTAQVHKRDQPQRHPGRGQWECHLLPGPVLRQPVREAQGGDLAELAQAQVDSLPARCGTYMPLAMLATYMLAMLSMNIGTRVCDDVHRYSLIRQRCLELGLIRSGWYVPCGPNSRQRCLNRLLHNTLISEITLLIIII